MINNCVVVGRLVADPEIKELQNGSKVCNITIAVPRSYKNANGVYDTDFVDCTLWQSVAENAGEYCRKGDMVGIKGRVETELYEKENGTKQKVTRIVAEKVTFLASNTKEKETEEPEME